MKKKSNKRSEIKYTLLNCGCCESRDERNYYRKVLDKKEIITYSSIAEQSPDERFT